MEEIVHHLPIGPILVNPEASGAGQTADEIIRTGLKRGSLPLDLLEYYIDEWINETLDS